MESRVAQKNRKFESHFDLAGYILEAQGATLADATEDVVLGRIDLLYALLRNLGLDTPGKIQPYMRDLDKNLERRPLSEQIIDKIIGNDPDRYSVFENVRGTGDSFVSVSRNSSFTSEFRDATGRFLEAWIDFEKAVRLQTGASEKRLTPLVLLLRKVRVDESTRFEIDRIRQIRNALVHGIDGVEFLDEKTLLSAVTRLDGITAQIRRGARSRKRTM